MTRWCRKLRFKSITYEFTNAVGAQKVQLRKSLSHNDFSTQSAPICKTSTTTPTMTVSPLTTQPVSRRIDTSGTKMRRSCRAKAEAALMIGFVTPSQCPEARVL